MSIMTQLEFELDFSNSEKQLARYILESDAQVLQLSIKELANRTYTSPATIVRLCRKLGLEGYSDFKIKYSAELQFDKKNKERIDVNFPFTKEDSQEQIVHQIAMLQQETIADTLQLIDFQSLSEIVDRLDAAKHIYIFGNGNSIVAALAFQHQMLRIGKLVEIKMLPGEQGFMSYIIQPEDMAIVISYSGETQEIMTIAQVLKNNKIATLGITSLGDNQLSKLCTYTMNTCSREKIISKIAPFSSKTSIEYLLNILFSCIFQKQYTFYTEKKVKTDRLYDHRHPYRSPINDETDKKQ